MQNKEFVLKKNILIKLNMLVIFLNLITSLISAAAVVNQEIKEEHPLFLAITHNNAKDVEDILKQKQNPNIFRVDDHQRISPLMLASASDFRDIVQILLADPNIDLNRKDINGKTALHYAVLDAKPVIVKMLIDAAIAKYGVSDDFVKFLSAKIDKGQFSNTYPWDIAEAKYEYNVDENYELADKYREIFNNLWQSHMNQTYIKKFLEAGFIPCGTSDVGYIRKGHDKYEIRLLSSVIDEIIEEQKQNLRLQMIKESLNEVVPPELADIVGQYAQVLSPDVLKKLIEFRKTLKP